VTDEQNRDFVARNAKHFISTNDSDKFEKHLSEMKKEMEQLAMAVASEDKAKIDPANTDSTDVTISSETISEPLVIDGLQAATLTLGAADTGEVSEDSV
jgi:hypothetical protein